MAKSTTLALLLGLFLGAPASAEEALPRGALARLGSQRFSNFGRPFALVFTPDSRVLASANWDGTIACWDLTTQQLLRSWDVSAGPVQALALAPDGQTLAAASQERSIQRWDRLGARPLPPLTGHDRPSHALVFSPDGKYLASADGDVRLWELAEGRMLLKVERARSPFFAADGTALSFVQLDIEPGQYRPRAIHLVTTALPTGKEVRRQPLPLPPNPDFRPSATGKWLLWHDGRGMRVREVRSGRERPLPGPGGAAVDVMAFMSTTFAFTPDERCLAVAYEDGRVALLELATGLVRHELMCSETNGPCLAVSPDNRLLAVGGLDRSFLLYDLSGRAKSAPQRLSPAELESLWTQLDVREGNAAHRAIWTLVSDAEAAVPLLARKLQPTRKLDAVQVGQLLRELRSDDFAVRTRARQELEKQQDLVEPLLRQALDEPLPLEARQRVEALLKRIDEGWSRQVRLLRALEVLECSATPAARRLLQQFAQDEYGPRLAEEARATLERLRRGERGPGQ